MHALTTTIRTVTANWRLVAAVSCVFLLAGCSLAPSDSPIERSHRSDRLRPCPPADPAITTGTGDFRFTGYAPLADRPVRVWYVAPDDPATADIVFVMHGMSRNGKDYRDDWKPLVRDRNAVVVVPEFSADAYPNASSYNLGNMVDSEGQPRPKDQWTFHIIEALFDFVTCEIGSDAESYALFGHSAGAQFVHRFIEFMPDHRASEAVAANAGWYTFLDDDIEFPYGLNDNPAGDQTMEAALESELTILLGANDIEDDDSLRDDEQAREQGRHRLERGTRFYFTARQYAKEESLPFAWRLHTVPGVGHSHSDMASHAARMLLGSPGA